MFERRASCPRDFSSSKHLSRLVGYANKTALSAKAGDTEFIRLAAAKLSKTMLDVASKLLYGVRSVSAGDLKRGKSNNFSETPDNFWNIVIQPRINHLQITVRGDISLFEGLTDLELKDDRGNTRFKVTNKTDVPKALKLIANAVRKP